MSSSAGPDRGVAGAFQAHGGTAVRLFLCVEPSTDQPQGKRRQRIGTSTASRRYSAGNCLARAASFGAS